MSDLGHVKVESVSNEGHGRKKVVMPVASTISINVSIAAAYAVVKNQGEAETERSAFKRLLGGGRDKRLAQMVVSRF